MTEHEEPTTPALPSETETDAGAESDAGVTEPESTEAPAVDAAPARRPRSTVLLAAVSVVLLVFGVTMAVLYQRQASARAARDRAVAARDAQLTGLRAQLAALQKQSADLQTALKAAQDKQLDPAGYEQIKNCVRETAAVEQSVAKVLAQQGGNLDLPPGAVVAYGGGPGKFKPSTVCTDAVKFLK